MLPRLILFDIDGTLIRNSGILSGKALLGAMQDFYRTAPLERKGVSFGGQTDPSLVERLLRANGVDVDSDGHRWTDLWRAYEKRYNLELEGASMHQMPVLCDGVVELIRALGEMDDIVLGLVTGNISSTARAKLRSVDIDPDLFKVGAFGDDHRDRDRLPAIAMERAKAIYPSHSFSSDRVYVVGDTPYDIQCAKANEFHSIAVATGSYDESQLREALPTVFFENLINTKCVLEAMGCTIDDDAAV